MKQNRIPVQQLIGELPLDGSPFQEGLRKFPDAQPLFDGLFFRHFLLIDQIPGRDLHEAFRLLIRQIGTAVFPRAEKQRLYTGHKPRDFHGKGLHRVSSFPPSNAKDEFSHVMHRGYHRMGIPAQDRILRMPGIQP